MFHHWPDTATRVSSISALLNPVLILTFGVIEGANAATRHPPFPFPRIVNEASQSDPGAAIQGAPNQK